MRNRVVVSFAVLAWLGAMVSGLSAWASPPGSVVGTFRPGLEGANRELLDRAQDLQDTAERANGGSLGCGVGTYAIQTSRGEVSVQGSLDAARVFGSNNLNAADLHLLLGARDQANKMGRGPMAGDRGDLCYVILNALSNANDPESVPFIVPLLEDSDDTVRGWAAIALLRLGEASPELQALVEGNRFPYAAIGAARSRGVHAPEWVKIARPEAVARAAALRDRANKLERERGFNTVLPRFFWYEFVDGGRDGLKDYRLAYVFDSDSVHGLDLCALLDLRDQANKTGEGPLAGEGGAPLCRMMLSVLAHPEEPFAKRYARPLLEDPDRGVRAWAAKVLVQQGEKGEELERLAASAGYPSWLSPLAPPEPPKKPNSLVLTAEKPAASGVWQAPSGGRAASQRNPAVAAVREPLKSGVWEAGSAAQEPPAEKEGPADILAQAVELQRKASRCNIGRRYQAYRAITSQGNRTIKGDQALMMVFGEELKLDDMHELLYARARANAGEENSMSGDPLELLYLVITTLAESDDPESIDPLASLVGDRDETVRIWATMALIRLAKAQPDLRYLIEPIEFQEDAITGARHRRLIIPDWIKTAKPAE